MDLNGFLSVAMRFLHISSAAALVGGVLYARVASTPVLSALPFTDRALAAQGAQAKFRGVLFTFLLLSIVSVLYNLLAGPHHTKQYHMWFGIKMLLVLHFLATSILW